MTLGAPGNPLRTLAFSPDGKTLASGGQRLSVLVWEATSRKRTEASITPLQWLYGHVGPVRSVAFSSDGDLAVSASGWPGGDKTVRVWDVNSAKEVQRFKGHTQPALDACFLPDGKRVLSGADDGTLRVWDVQTGREQMHMKVPERGQSVAVTADGRLAATGSDDSNCYLFDLTTGEKVERFVGHAQRVLDVDISPDGQFLLSGGDDLSAILWSVESGLEVRRLEGHTGAIERVRFSPDGQRLATCGREGLIILWDRQTGEEIKRFAHRAGIYDAAFSPDGQLVVTACRDGSLGIWNIATGQQLYRLEDHREPVWGVAISPNGRYLLSAGGGAWVDGKPAPGSDWALRLWKMPEVQESGEPGEEKLPATKTSSLPGPMAHEGSSPFVPVNGDSDVPAKEWDR